MKTVTFGDVKFNCTILFSLRFDNLIIDESRSSTTGLGSSRSNDLQEKGDYRQNFFLIFLMFL